MRSPVRHHRRPPHRRPRPVERLAAGLVSLVFFIWVLYQVCFTAHPNSDKLPHSRKRHHLVVEESQRQQPADNVDGLHGGAASPSSESRLGVSRGGIEEDVTVESAAVVEGGDGGGGGGDDALTGWQSHSTVELNCPTYSGPGWRSDVPSKVVRGAAEAVDATFSGSGAASSSSSQSSQSKPLPRALIPRLSTFPLASLRLTQRTHSRFALGESTNTRYLNMLEPNRLVWSFRREAGLSPPAESSGAKAEPYTGWEHPGSELRGHFVGHYLSAAAMAAAATGDPTVVRNSQLVLDALEARTRTRHHPPPPPSTAAHALAAVACSFARRVINKRGALIGQKEVYRGDTHDVLLDVVRRRHWS